MKFSLLVLTALVLQQGEAFAPSTDLPGRVTPRDYSRSISPTIIGADLSTQMGVSSTALSAMPEKIWKKAQKLATPVSLAIGLTFFSPLQQSAQASAPVMALPKAEGRDPATEALTEMERKQMKKTQEDLNEMARQAREIEKTQGSRARDNFEKEFKIKQQQRAEARKLELEQLKRDLLDQGIDPFIDLEGQRQVILFQKGVDLGEVQGTQFNLEKEWERRSPKKSMKFKKAANRKMIALMVQDLKNREIDALDYFEKHQDQTQAVLNLPEASVLPLLEKYSANLEEYGQIVPPKEGEISAKERMAQKSQSPEAKRKARAEEKRKKAELKAKEREEKRLAQAEAKAARLAAKEAAKTERDRAKAAAAAAATGTLAEAETDVDHEGTDSQGEIINDDEMSLEDKVQKEETSIAASAASRNTGVLLVAGGGLAAFGLYRKRQENALEEERRRQFNLLMGESSKTNGDSNPLQAYEFDNDDDLDLDPMNSVSSPTPPPAATDSSSASTPPKRRLGLKNVFTKKSSRETDINNLISPEAAAPEFSTLLAKLLTYGAPGRFPNIERLPGGKPLESFDLEAAKDELVKAREQSNLSDAEGAEIFADVVNCMLIDIVDLASSSLKEKDDSVTVDAINIVVDFMNHAASMYDAVAGDVIIKPVVYEGTLRKSKLEQMYSTYAVSGMMNMGDMTEDFDDRVGLLQDVFNINEKKAEGLMMKAVQKNMMKMLKDGKGMEGMEDMLKGMGGMDGLDGLSGMENGEGPSPEQLKEMLLALKEMKESGSIPDSELEEVKNQFKEAFGSSIDEVMLDANNNEGDLTAGDKELLELMKSILG